MARVKSRAQTRPKASAPPQQPAGPPVPPPAGGKKAAESPRHGGLGGAAREAIETVVFVVVLVMMLQLFVAQAFVIPTGSMATTLYGNHIEVTCPECGYEFAVNAAGEVEQGVRVEGYACPNCGHAHSNGGLPKWSSGDRVIVSKTTFAVGREPDRWIVPVFNFPGESQKAPYRNPAAYPRPIADWARANPKVPIDGPLDLSKWEKKNYIKRLAGKPGETIAIGNGDLWMTARLKYEDRPRPEDPKDNWLKEYMYRREYARWDFLKRGEYGILRKPPAVIRAAARLVYDNDHQAKALIGKVPPRWQPDPTAPDGWTPDDADAPKVFTHAGGGLTFLKYQQLLPPGNPNDFAQRETYVRNWRAGTNFEPRLIKNTLGYNSAWPGGGAIGEGEYWVGDLMVGCEAEVTAADAAVVLELARGRDRFRATFNAGDDSCTLTRLTIDEEPVEMARQENVGFKGTGTYDLRLANFDHRLTVWIDGGVIDFGDKADYRTPLSRGEAGSEKEFWVKRNDINRPARLGAAGAVTLRHVKLYRDTYYTLSGDAGPNARAESYYVQPGCYLCLGDNSAASLDSRAWGSVPRRLMAGRALLIYWPYWRIGTIR